MQFTQHRAIRLVRALGAVSYGAVVEVMDGVRGSGAERIGLVTQAPETAAGP